MPHGKICAAFAEAFVAHDDARLEEVRNEMTGALGVAAMIDAAGIAAIFNAIGRIADATGTPIDDVRLEPTAAFREELGISAFPSGIG